jgi:glucose/arabinose dehydrogenase
MPVVGPDGFIYFSQGAMTNTGVVGLDAYEIGWLRRLPHAHDVPGHPVQLRGENFPTRDPLSGGEASTGAFLPFGTESTFGQVIEPSLPCTASVMRCRADGSNLELVAWGLRNAFGMCLLPDGRLIAIDQGADDRGSRPVANAPDLLFEVVRGRWYGWPDFINGRPITSDEFLPERGPRPSFLLANHGALPGCETALMEFRPHSAATRLDLAIKGSVEGLLVVALFGDERPMTAAPGERVGRCLVAVEPGRWTMRPLHTHRLARPIDVKCNPYDGRLYVVDFGHFEMTSTGIEATPGSGAVWRQTLGLER